MCSSLTAFPPSRVRVRVRGSSWLIRARMAFRGTGFHFPSMHRWCTTRTISSADGRDWERYSCSMIFVNEALPLAIQPAATDPDTAPVRNQCGRLAGVAVPREPTINGADTDLLLTTGREGGTLGDWATVIEQIREGGLAPGGTLPDRIAGNASDLCLRIQRDADSARLPATQIG